MRGKGGVRTESEDTGVVDLGLDEGGAVEVTGGRVACMKI